MSISTDQLLARLRAQIAELAPEAARARADAGALLLDVREADEVAAGIIPGARHVPRGFLELRIEELARDRAQPIVVYCAAGARSLFAARALEELGYTDVSSLAGGFDAWKARGLPWQKARALTAEQRLRYARHLLLGAVGEDGQRRLLDARVLLVGAGGLGSPVALYLAAAGVGHLGVVDHDRVDPSNLQRQILHRTADAGVPKVDSAARAIRDLNPDVEVTPYPVRLAADNVMAILDDGWEIVVDGCDNFTTRYVVNDACVARGLPNVHGSIHKFEGQASVFAPSLGGACYRCLYPEPPPAGAAPSCAEAGVLGVLPGLLGTIQAAETIKLILGLGEPLVGRLLQIDALSMRAEELRFGRDPACPACAAR